jgi:hypothetical protein
MLIEGIPYRVKMITGIPHFDPPPATNPLKGKVGDVVTFLNYSK